MKMAGFKTTEDDMEDEDELDDIDSCFRTVDFDFNDFKDDEREDLHQDN